MAFVTPLVYVAGPHKQIYVHAAYSKHAPPTPLLDWEKAFDKIDHEKLMEALGRLNIPDKLLNGLNVFIRSLSLKWSLEGMNLGTSIRPWVLDKGAPSPPTCSFLL